ncbi:MAG: HAD family hydrolase [Bacteroidales bacterium]|nr:HAD family hydrolase [Bacteroidales bacterium]
METKVVIFDLDGTLYDNRGLASYLIFMNIFHLNLLGAERMERKNISGTHYGSAEELLSDLFSRISSRTGRKYESVKRWYTKKYLLKQARALSFFFKAKPWVKPMLQDLKKRGIKTVCFSDYGAVEEKLGGIGLNAKLFDLVIDAPTAGGLKPCRESFLRIAEIMNVRPSEILVLGDRQDADGKGAALAGMRFMLVSRDSSKVPDIKSFLK